MEPIELELEVALEIKAAGYKPVEFCKDVWWLVGDGVVGYVDCSKGVWESSKLDSSYDPAKSPRIAPNLFSALKEFAV